MKPYLKNSGWFLKDEMLERFREDYEDMAKVMFLQEPPYFDEVLRILEEVEENRRRF
jgi:hypothetical protein